MNRLDPPGGSPRRLPRTRAARRALAALVTLCLAALATAVLPAQAQEPPSGGAAAAAEQVLTWTADDRITEYRSAPATAVAGEATIVFENSAATGNTSGMPHTLTFDTSSPEHNDDVSLNLMANPNDDNNGRHEATVALSPGTYRYFCSIPGHGQMEGVLVVTEAGGPEDTTAPEATASVSGERNADGAYIGSATVTLEATDDLSGVDRVDYAVDGGDYTAYEAPVVVNTPGEHTVRYRATDKAGNTSEEKAVAFTVVEPPAEDTTPPEVSAAVDGERNAEGHYVARATVTLEAADAGSGVAGIEYAVDGSGFTAYGGPVTVHTAGEHTVAYRATDRAGNSSDVETVAFTVVESGGGGGEPEPEPACPETDDRPLVVVGEERTGVPNRETRDGCTVNELIEDEASWPNHGRFLRHVREVTDALLADRVLNKREHRAVNRAAARSDIGRAGHRKGYRTLFDGSRKSFAQWEHVGGGGFELNGDGTMTSSTTVGGMGMLWFPEREFGDFSLKLQFRDDAPAGRSANSGVFVRFPEVHGHPEESRPEWVAIKYGHEVQILDAEGGDQYKTGSVYGFDRVTRDGAMVAPKGSWNDYEIRVVGQHYSVYRNGQLINEFDNAPGQLFSPPRSGDPGTDGRQHDTGYVGLQTHGTSDVISFRDIRIREL